MVLPVFLSVYSESNITIQGSDQSTYLNDLNISLNSLTAKDLIQEINLN